MVRAFATYSVDKVANFRPNAAISCGKSNGEPLGGGAQKTLGDYIGIDFGGKFFYPAWGDNSAGNTEVFTKKVPAP